METGSAFLEYGALGLLALVLIGIGSGIWRFGKDLLERQAKRDQFLEELANNALAAKDAQMEAWNAASLEVSTGLRNMVSALDRVVKSLAEQEVRAAQRHDRVMSAFDRRSN